MQSLSLCHPLKTWLTHALQHQSDQVRFLCFDTLNTPEFFSSQYICFSICLILISLGVINTHINSIICKFMHMTFTFSMWHFQIHRFKNFCEHHHLKSLSFPLPEVEESIPEIGIIWNEESLIYWNIIPRGIQRILRGYTLTVFVFLYLTPPSLVTDYFSLLKISCPFSYTRSNVLNGSSKPISQMSGHWMPRGSVSPDKTVPC